ncbi:hypothetical protein EI555_001558 [Monodon monoceros]|uniref:TGF-beta family profile domain-containing protein n=1 Tax=Monodon monoceros TaxID=40151 RepID=A0A4U1F8P9_MONMO|nr:hypothetical protein EI555_001558 [Monodon monoceros]
MRLLRDGVGPSPQTRSTGSTSSRSLGSQPSLCPRPRALHLRGSCRRARSPHDLSLASLLGAGALRPPPGSRPVSQPCCRPTRYEAVSFMDVNSTWRTVDRLSATACGCLG